MVYEFPRTSRLFSQVDGSLALRQHSPSDYSAQCVFCPDLAENRYEFGCGSVVALRDGFPVTPGHFLVIPRRHVRDFFEMTAEERADANEMLAFLALQLRRDDPSIEGFNIGINCGDAAGQTVPHAHTHLIPRRTGDTANPRGGVRGVVPEKMAY